MNERIEEQRDIETERFILRMSTDKLKILTFSTATIEVIYFFPLFKDVDECSSSKHNNCSSNADCSNLPGSFKCHCKSGYTGDGVDCAGRILES